MTLASNIVAPSFIPNTAYAEGAPTVLFSIGSYQMNVYSLCMMLGFLCSILTIVYFWRREKYPLEILMTLIIITIPASIIGARAAFVIERLIYTGKIIPDWYAIWHGGLSIQGGVILAIVLDLWYAYTKRNVIDVRKGASMIIPAILIGQVVGRWGNFSNHEVYGKIDWSGASALIFGKTFASHMYISDAVSTSLGLDGAYRYPLFLYEGIANALGYILIVWVINYLWLLKPGVSAGLYLIWYGLVRQIMEPLREESYGLYSYLAILFVIIGTIVAIYYQFFGRVKYVLNTTKYNKALKQSFSRSYTYANEELYLAHVNVTKLSYVIKKLKLKF